MNLVSALLISPEKSEKLNEIRFAGQGMRKLRNSWGGTRFAREQPIFSCKAHVFHIDPKTKRSWLPASSSAVSVSFFYDSTRMLYRIISVEGTKMGFSSGGIGGAFDVRRKIRSPGYGPSIDANCSNLVDIPGSFGIGAVINSTVTPAMTFTKTSQKFGQWSDLRANTVYGLGFPNEAELNVFIEKFNEVKAATIESAKVAASNGGIASVPTGIQVQPNVPIPPANIIQRAPSPGGLGSTGTSLSESSMLNAHVPGKHLRQVFQRRRETKFSGSRGAHPILTDFLGDDFVAWVQYSGYPLLRLPL
ncbi:unnamed protein product [Notodromas monacha]|uniref:WH1 domain-containing protein n=1 Tax=Notodromas monacha TaxID=399045 RepID=A0A7R9BNV6_9CRUS|nr:unnamed protein product [Notodromas monacha]CAG0917597.1 unnamed protein product [Notodromas monacha]